MGTFGLCSSPTCFITVANDMKTKTIGNWNQCDLLVEGENVSPIHAHIQLGNEGYLTVLDAGSDHGTWLNRNTQWIRVVKVELGSGDRIRFGDSEVALEQLVSLFGERVRVQLRDNQALRMPALLAERLAAAEQRVVLERPRRNPLTGNIEEDI
jgi:pSer/pThr/pTyr-binding forkhead associated (FHA) protein